ncbi:MAG TPA: 1,4-alpha-glucan branching protein domain-containing protein [Anaeromyxobacteraceae bacterium]|nr:1,4-alpha-glucan branching protein domain-containing protein [Anaeromyxobacteraceae bacterium]
MSEADEPERGGVAPARRGPDPEGLGDLPASYGEDAFVALARDPRTLFLYWDGREPLEAAGAGSSRPRAQLVVSVRDDDGSFRRCRVMDIALEARSHYVHDLEPGRVYRAELRLASGGEPRALGAPSNEAALPPLGPSPVVDDAFAAVPWDRPLGDCPLEVRRGAPFHVEAREELARLSDGSSRSRPSRPGAAVPVSRGGDRERVPQAPRYLVLHLHAHLPFVRHPERAGTPEEEWLSEAVTWSYLPLLAVLDRLAGERVPYRLSLSLSPTLLAMLADPLLKRRYAKHLARLRALADAEVRRTRRATGLHALALRYRDELGSLAALLEDRYRGDLVGAFGRLEEAGHVEIATSAATHAFLPLLAGDPASLRAQVAVAVAEHRRHFGRAPAGMWLPECGYRPGLEGILAAQGLRYFFVDAHGLVDAVPRPRCGVYAPVYTPAGPAAFGRDPGASRAISDPESGYPSDPWYRDFYRDIGWDLDAEHVRAFERPLGTRRNVGIKYWRAGGARGGALYDPRRARQRARAHAEDFVAARRRQLEDLASRTGGTPPVVVAPFDAELFGHWWYEGTEFLEFLLRASARDRQGFRLATPGDYLRENPEQQVATPAASSWGAGGYAGTWLDGSNDWVYRHLHRAAARLEAVARDRPDASGLERRALDQAARELLLAQASDWAFILRTGTAVDYAIRRTRDHALRSARLADEVRAGRVDEAWLAALESRDNLFPGIDSRVFGAR